jgi:hypothetical protein
MAVDVSQANLRLIWEEGNDIVLSLDPLQGHWTGDQAASKLLEGFSLRVDDVFDAR